MAIDQNGDPCYAQWPISAVDNERIQKYFRGTFPVLAPDEALLEGAFTPESHRGKGIMPRAMALIAEGARNLGARYVITFVAEENIPSLKGCKRAGFCAMHAATREQPASRVAIVLTDTFLTIGS